MEKKEVNLTEMQLLFKQHQLEELSIEIESLRINISGYQKMIELKLPEKRARNTLLKMQDELRNKERNATVLEKQIKTKKEILIE